MRMPHPKKYETCTESVRFKMVRTIKRACLTQALFYVIFNNETILLFYQIIHMPKKKVLNILVVDDTQSFRKLFEKMLGTMLQHNVTTAANGKEGLDEIARNPPGHYDLVMSDWQMPVMNGSEFLRILKTWNPCPEIIFMSAEADTPAFTRMAAELGVTHVLKKPSPLSVLADLIHQIANSK